jgi:hypothetical protein
MDMNAASILRSKAVSVASATFIGIGLLGGIAFAATPASSDATSMTAPDTTTVAAAEKAAGKLKAALDALVAKNVITQAQEDAIIAALSEHRDGHPKLRQLVGDVLKESVSYLGVPADQVKQQLAAGKSLGEIANGTSGKSRDALVGDLDAAAAARIKAAVVAGTITQAQADQLTPKVDDAIVKIVDHKGSPKPAATN